MGCPTREDPRRGARIPGSHSAGSQGGLRPPMIGNCLKGTGKDLLFEFLIAPRRSNR